MRLKLGLKLGLKLSIFLVGLIAGIGLGMPPHSGAAQSAPTPTPYIPPFGPVITTPVASVTATSLPPERAATRTPALPALRTEMMGIQIHPVVEISTWWGMVDRAQFMGLRWIKVQVNWAQMEPEAGVYSQAFSVVGDHLFYSGQRGFKNLISVVNAPDWARPAEARGQLNGPPADPASYVNFLNAIFDKWGTAYINAIELWNEPNLAREWTGAPKTAAAYKKLFDPAYNAVRARSADMVIITAGPAPAGDTADGSVNDRRWLRDLYTLGLPIGDPNFAVGVHPYGWANAPDARCCANPSRGWDDQPFFFFLDNLYDYRQIMVENGHSSGKLWATEFGWATFQGLRYRDHIAGPPAIPPAEASLGWMNVLDEQQMAQYIIRAFELAQNGDLATFMGPMFLWNMNFASLAGYVNENTPSLPEAGFSVLNSDWGTRPIYDMLQFAPRR